MTSEPPYDQRNTIAGQEHQPCDWPQRRVWQQAFQNRHNDNWAAADGDSDDNCEAKFDALVPQPRSHIKFPLHSMSKAQSLEQHNTLVQRDATTVTTFGASLLLGSQIHLTNSSYSVAWCLSSRMIQSIVHPILGPFSRSHD